MSADSGVENKLKSMKGGAGPSQSADTESRIYFATDTGGLKQYSFVSNQVNTVVNSSEVLLGVAYDSRIDKIYWCSSSTIFRANRDGTERETVLNTTECKYLQRVEWTRCQQFSVS